MKSNDLYHKLYFKNNFIIALVQFSGSLNSPVFRLVSKVKELICDIANDEK